VPIRHAGLSENRVSGSDFRVSSLKLAPSAFATAEDHIDILFSLFVVPCTMGMLVSPKIAREVLPIRAVFIIRCGWSLKKLGPACWFI